MTLQANLLASFDFGKSQTYPVKRTATGRVKLRNNETFYVSDTGYQQATTSPTKKARFIYKRKELDMEEIDQHIAMKFQLVALTFTQVYNTPFHYSIGRTHAQGESAKRIVVQEGKTNHIVRLQAVHSSLLPVLYSQDRKAYENWLTGEGLEPEKSIFNAKSNYDNHQNSTRNLPEIINTMDRILEGGAKNEKLRSGLIIIINQLAKKELKLEEGLQIFAIKYRNIVHDQLDKLKKEVGLKAKKKRRICRIFLDCVELQLKEISPRFFEGLLDLPPMPIMKAAEREMIIENACGLKTRTSGVESCTQHTVVSPLKRAALGRLRRRPHHFEAGVTQHLFEVSKNAEEKKLLQRHFNTSEEQLKATGDCEKAYEFIKSKKIDCHPLIEKAKNLWQEIQTLKNAYRISVINYCMMERNLEHDEKTAELLSGKFHLNLQDIQYFADLLKLDMKVFYIDND